MTTTLSSRAPAEARLPLWATLCDAAAILLVVLAALLAIRTGFHAHIGWVRLSVTGWLRPLVWALAIGTFRHLVIPRPPVYVRLAAGIHALRSPALAAALRPLLVTRLTVILVAFFAVATIGFERGAERFHLYRNPALNLVARWDAEWYVDIAAQGYSWNGNPLTYNNVVFFPAYPLLTRYAGWIVGDVALGGVLVSLVAFLCGLVYVYRLAGDEFGAAEPEASLWFLAWYPFAVFYGIVYTEALFLLVAVGAFYHFRRSAFLAAGAWGFLAGLTRQAGALISLSLLLFVVEDAARRDGRLAWVFGGVNRPLLPSRRYAPALLAACMPVLGMAVYSAFIYRLTGDPFAWMKGQQAWGRVYHGWTTLVTEPAATIAGIGVFEYAMSYPVTVMNAAAGAFCLVLAWPGCAAARPAVRGPDSLDDRPSPARRWRAVARPDHVGPVPRLHVARHRDLPSTPADLACRVCVRSGTCRHPLLHLATALLSLPSSPRWRPTFHAPRSRATSRPATTIPGMARSPTSPAGKYGDGMMTVRFRESGVARTHSRQTGRFAGSANRGGSGAVTAL